MRSVTRCHFALDRLYYDTDGRCHAPSLAAMFTALPELSRALDSIAVAAHLDGTKAVGRTLFAAVRSVAPGNALTFEAARWVERPGDDLFAAHALPWNEPPDIARFGLPPELETTARATGARPLLRSLAFVLATRIAGEIASSDGAIAVALSGGLDSAVVLALATEAEPDIAAVVAAPSKRDFPGYSELTAALETARDLGVDPAVIEISADDVRAALPAAIRAFETPLYNLHPVTRYVLAAAASRERLAVLLTGDGADHVFNHENADNYLPLVSAACEAFGIHLRSPFLRPAYVWGPPDRDKHLLRDLAARLPIRMDVVRGGKQGGLAPPIDLSPVVSQTTLDELGRLIGRDAPRLHADMDDRLRVRWSTLALFVDAFEAWR